MNYKKIFPLEVNFELKNFKEYFKARTIELNKKNKKRIFLLDAATYKNLGDQAISYAISRYIIDNFKEYEYIEISEKEFLRNFLYLKKNINKDDIICMNGGGNMGNLYPKYEAIRRKVIRNFKNNRIIIFPQTIDYEKDKYGVREQQRSVKIYNSNSNLIICAREKKSYNLMKEIYNNVILISDIVFYLYGKITIEEPIKYKNKIGICLRKDKESIFTDEERKKIENQLKNSNEIIYLSTMSNSSYIDKKNREIILKEKLAEFKKCDFIVTDRLHGMIFSILCDVPCIVFDNSNKKVSGVLEMINKYSPNVIKLNKENRKELSDKLFKNMQPIKSDINKIFNDLKEIILNS